MNKHIFRWLMEGCTSFESIKNQRRLFTNFCLVSLLLFTVLACGGTAPVQSPPTHTVPPQIPPTQSTPVQSTDTQPPLVNTETPGSEMQADLSPGDHTRSLIHNGAERTYILHIPPGFDNFQPVPLVLAFHGLNLNANEMIRISGFNSQADASGFIVVYPNGLGEVQSWNGGVCCGAAAKYNVDDVGFVRALIGDLSTTINIDPKQVYATGFSNGAIMSYRLACDLSDLIAAVGPVSATLMLEDIPSCQPARPVSVIHFHGTADDLNPYNGGESASGFQFGPVDTAIQFWVNFNGCPTQPQTTESGSIRNDIYSPCESGSVVELYTIAGGKHAWPGGEAVSQAIGEPNMEISATSLMWEFFLSHPMH